jgi:6-phosphogluconolactonase
MGRNEERTKRHSSRNRLQKGITDKRSDTMNRKILAAFAVVAILMGSTAAVLARNYHRADTAGAVYAMTNAAGDNQVVIFTRNGDGLLTLADSVSTGGLGDGIILDPLGSQNSLVLTGDNRFLLAVNAGSNNISVFRVESDGLELTDVVASGGELPVSLALFHDLVYVLNEGSPNITGFFLNHLGQLLLRPASTRGLGSGEFAQVGFDTKGENLVVTDRLEHEILVFPLAADGLPSLAPITSSSSGLGPFGFIFDNQGHLLVSEAGSGAVSSYDINDDGTLQVISASVANDQIATCWIAGNNLGYVFTANTGSQTISAYEGDHSGQVELLDKVAGLGNRPIDMDISANGRFLYALDPAAGAIDIFEINPNGSLTNLGPAAGGFSIFAQGIAVR